MDTEKAKVPYSLLSEVKLHIPEIRDQSGTQIDVEGNTFIFTGEHDQITRAQKSLHDIMSKLSTTINPRYDLSIKIDMKYDKLDQTVLPTYFPSV